MADSKEFKRIKRLMGDSYEPRLREIVLLLVSINEIKPISTSERVRKARLKLAVLDRLGLTRIGKTDESSDADETGRPNDEGDNDFNV